MDTAPGTSSTPPADCTRLGCGRRTDDAGGASCFCTDPAAMARLFPDDREAEVEQYFERERLERTPAYPPYRAPEPWFPGPR